MLISPHLKVILEEVKKNTVISIVAPTGTGKSIGIPDILAENGYVCYVSVPTRTAAYSLCEYQKKIQKEKKSKIRIGFAAEGNINYDKNTDIVYATSGHIRRKMLSHFKNSKATNILFCNVLFVDESHIGSIDNRIILSLWRMAAKQGKKVPKLLIVSATPVEMFTDVNVKNYTVNVKSLGVEIKYNSANYEIGNKKLYTDTAKIALNIHNNENISKGHILIFAPGKSEIESIINELGNVNADVISAHGQLEADELNNIYKESKKRKIIVATNVAEMSLTIENIGFIVDTMTEKKSETSENGGMKLVVSYISKDSAVQRAGRTGRTIKGICYRMCTEDFYDKLDDHRIEEIHRVPIHSPIIELLDIGLDPREVLPDLEKQKLDTTVYELNSLGLTIPTSNNKIATVTEKGHFCVKFPFSVKNSAFLWGWLHGKKNIEKTDKYITEKAALLFDIDKIDYGSSSFPSDILFFAEILKDNIDPSGGTLVISINEDCGEYSLQCLSHSENCTVVSINNDKNKCDIISYNLTNANIFVRGSIDKNFETSVYNMDPTKYFEDKRYATMVVLNIKTSDDIDLLYKVLKNNCTTRIAVKINANFIDNLNEFINNITDEITLNLEQYETKKGSFYLISTQYQNPVDVIYDNVPLCYPDKKYRNPIYPGLVICSIIDTYGPSYFWKPKKEKGQSRDDYKNVVNAHRAQYYDDLVGYSDMETYINLWNEYQKQKNIKSWVRNRSVNLKKFNELIKTINRSISICETYINGKIKVGPFTTSGSISVARPILADVYKDNILTLKNVNYVDKSFKTFILDSGDTVNNYDDDGKPHTLIPLVSTEIKSTSNSNSIHVFSLSLDVDKIATKIKYKSSSLNKLSPLKLSSMNDIELSSTNDNELQSIKSSKISNIVDTIYDDIMY